MGKVGVLPPLAESRWDCSTCRAASGVSANSNSVEVFGADHAVTKQGLEIDDFIPVFRTVQNHGNAPLELGGLRQRQDFHDLIQGAETPRKGDQPARQLREP